MGRPTDKIWMWTLDESAQCGTQRFWPVERDRQAWPAAPFGFWIDRALLLTLLRVVRSYAG